MVLWGGVAAATRVIGAVVPLLLLARLVEMRRDASAHQSAGPHPALALLCGLPAAAHLAFLADRFGDPLVFTEAAQHEGWEEGLSLRSVLKVDFWGIFTGSEPGDAVYHSMQVVSMLLTLVVLAMLPRVWRRVSPAYALVAATLIGIPLLSNNDFLGFGRYALACFPVALVGAEMLAEHERYRRVVLTASASLLLLTATLSGMNYLVM
jgi:hypothetical protein